MKGVLVPIEKIENPVNQFATGHHRIGIDKAETATAVADYVKTRGPVGTGKYACMCNNFGPRFLEDSMDGCCAGCFAMALDMHQEMDVNGVKPVTRDMIKNATWGFYLPNIDKLKGSKVDVKV